MGGIDQLRARVGAATALVLAALALPLAGCGEDETVDPSTTTETARPTAPEASTSPGKTAGESDPAPETVELYFTSGEQFSKVDREIPKAGDELVAVTEALVEGPTKGEQQAKTEAQTQIPAATVVEDVTVENGVAVVELSDEFTEDIPIDPAKRSQIDEQELSARLGQVTFTLTQFERVDKAKVLAGGTPVRTPQTPVRPAEALLSRGVYDKPSKGPVSKSRPRGTKSKSTKQIQKRLAALRYLPKSAVDGIDGYRTQQAVLAFQSWQGLDRDGQVGPATTAALAQAKRPKPKASGPSRRIEVYNAKGVTLLIKGGAVKRAIHSSSGAPGYETTPGTFTVFRKELNSWSVPYSVWLPYASYFNAGIAFHESPDVPTFPASHGCVRIPAPEAQIVYRFASNGTTVVVF